MQHPLFRLEPTEQHIVNALSGRESTAYAIIELATNTKLPGLWTRAVARQIKRDLENAERHTKT